MSVKRAIFVPGVGQYDNIGDIVLRRPLLSALRPLGPLHVYLGDAPPGYAEALALDERDHVYRSYSRWYWALLRSALLGRAHYVFKPGEIQLTVVGMKEHVGMLPGLAAVRLSGGRVLRLGSGARGPGRVGAALMTPSIALSHLTIWRDAKTRTWLHGGDVMPDLAFVTEPPGEPEPRALLTVSMRGDRPEPDADFFDTVLALATDRGLTLVAVTQVGRDAERTALLAQRLASSADDWDGGDHRKQEAALHATYRRSEVVVSDRLHVLIAAAVDGAIPLALLTAASDKIDRHFIAAGLPAISVEAGDHDALEKARTIIRSWPGAEGMERARVEVSHALARAAELLAGASR